jgi:plastocyanin
MRKTVVAVALTALLGLSAGACGGDKKDDDDASSPKTTSGPAAATIKASGTTWSPDEVVVKAGDTVEWDVKGSIVHDLKGDEGISHKAASTFTVTHTFAKAGTYSYQCTIHPGMTGTITVNP